jgi:hypothetical protein
MAEVEQDEAGKIRFRCGCRHSTPRGVQEKTAQTRRKRSGIRFVDSAIAAGSDIEFTLTLPPEII